MSRRRRAGDDLAIVPRAATLARIIHQTAAARTLAAPIAGNIDLIRRSNPCWEHRLYDDGDALHFIRATYGARVSRLYERLDESYGAARADLFRYLVVHATGGIYLDIKSTPDRPLDEVLRADDPIILSQWRNGSGEVHERWGLWPELDDVEGGEFQQWFVAAPAGHPYLRAAISSVLSRIEAYDPKRDGVGGLAVLRLTGPIAFTRAIAPMLARGDHRLVQAERDLGLRYSIFEGDGHRAFFERHYAASSRPLVLSRKALLVRRIERLQRAAGFATG